MIGYIVSMLLFCLIEIILSIYNIVRFLTRSLSELSKAPKVILPKIGHRIGEYDNSRCSSDLNC
jgi:hypothetical protein